MAVNTTGSGSTVTGVTTTHPDNINGGGLKFQDKKYQVNTGKTTTVNTDGTLDVKISKLGGNLLRVNNDGLYYGTAAPPEVAYLYVDAVRGVDQNPFEVSGAGTKEKPLKTFKYACDLAVVGTTRTIYLMENQDHHVYADNKVRIKSGVLGIRPYGPQIEALAASNIYLSSAYDEMIRRRIEPRLVFTGFVHTNDADPDRYVVEANCIEALGDIHISLDTITLVNDVTFNTNQFTGRNNRPWFVAFWYRIQAERLDFVRGRLLVRGDITGDFKDAVYRSTAPADMPKWSFGFFYGTPINITLTVAEDTSVRNLPCYIVSPPGWRAALTTSSGVHVAAPRTLEHMTAVAKRIYGYYKDDLGNGVKMIKVPNTNIPSAYFP